MNGIESKDLSKVHKNHAKICVTEKRSEFYSFERGILRDFQNWNKTMENQKQKKNENAYYYLRDFFHYYQNLVRFCIIRICFSRPITIICWKIHIRYFICKVFFFLSPFNTNSDMNILTLIILYRQRFLLENLYSGYEIFESHFFFFQFLLLWNAQLFARFANHILPLIFSKLVSISFLSQYIV